MIHIVPGVFHHRCQMPVVQTLFIFCDSSNVKHLQSPSVTSLGGCHALSIAPCLYFLYDTNYDQLTAKVAYMHVFFILLE